MAPCGSSWCPSCFVTCSRCPALSGRGYLAAGVATPMGLSHVRPVSVFFVSIVTSCNGGERGRWSSRGWPRYLSVVAYLRLSAGGKSGVSCCACLRRRQMAAMKSNAPREQQRRQHLRPRQKLAGDPWCGSCASCCTRSYWSTLGTYLKNFTRLT